MARIVIVVYRPFEGKEQELLSLVKEHLPVLNSQHLITDRKPIVMRSGDGCIVEIFEWKSTHTIEKAHSNPVVQELWMRFNNVCNYEIPANVEEFKNLFSEFEPIDF